MWIVTGSPQETRAFGKTLGAFLEAPLTLVLVGDLGSGKTVFVQGLASGLGIDGETEVTSPSFALVHEHRGRLPLYHVDLYRLEQEMELETLGLEEFMEGRAVVAVEWGERLPRQYLGEHLTVRFATLSDTQRRIEITATGGSASRVLDLLQASAKLP